MAHLKVFKQRLLQQFQDERDSKFTGATSVASETPAQGTRHPMLCFWDRSLIRSMALILNCCPTETPGARPSPASSSQLRPTTSGKSPVPGSTGLLDSNRYPIVTRGTPQMEYRALCLFDFCRNSKISSHLNHHRPVLLRKRLKTQIAEAAAAAVYGPATSPRESQYQPAGNPPRSSKSVLEERQVERQQSTSKLTLQRTGSKKGKGAGGISKGAVPERLLAEAPSAGSNFSLPTSPRSGSRKKARPSAPAKPALLRTAGSTTAVPIDWQPELEGPATRLVAVPLTTVRSLGQFCDALQSENPTVFADRPPLTELAFLDTDGDWLILDADVPWQLVTATAKRVVVLK